MFDPVQAVDDYLNLNTWETHENSNKGYDLPSMMNHLSTICLREYALTRIYPKHISQAYRDGFFHIHDLGVSISGYCVGYDILDILLKGFYAKDRTSAGPAKHFSSWLSQLANYFGTLQTEWAGAQALNSIDTISAPFIRVDNLSYSEIRQYVQQFVFWLNIDTKGGESPFTNITLDMCPSKDYKDMPVVIGGEAHPELGTYSDYQPEMDLFNRALLDVMSEGDINGRVFTFPVITFNITEDFDWDSPFTDCMFEAMAKYGIGYIQNYIGSDLDPDQVRAFCCRLQLDISQLINNTGGIFGSASKTGSIGVVTLSLPMLAAGAKDVEDYYNLLSKYCDLASESLELKRKVINRTYRRGLLPYTEIYLPEGYKNHFSTIGVVGGHEACMNLLGKGIQTPEGCELMQDTLEFIKDKALSYQKKTGHLYNCEATPAESASYSLALKFKDRFPEGYTSGEEVPFFTNSTNLPVDYTRDIWSMIRHQEKLAPRYNGGAVTHIFLGERITKESAKKLVRTICYETKLNYFSITPTFSICPIHGYISGDHEYCPICEKEGE